MKRGNLIKLQKYAFAIVVALITPLIGALPSWADTDPFPGVEYRQEIPGTRISGAVGESWDSFNASAAVAAHSCAAGSGNASEFNASGPVRSYYCVKTWQPTSTIDAWAEYREALAAAQAAAAAESQAWNEANPGKQKCVQWGPITSPDGGVSSGGVCANIVSGTSSSPSVGQEQPAGTVGEGDISSPSSSSSVSQTTSSSVSAPLPTAPPIPNQTSRIQGNGYPFTWIVEGQVGLAGCPAPYNAANGLIAAIGIGTFTECWPAAAWAANRIGGETWQMFKATGGTYDINAVIDNREKINLLRAKAKEVAEAAALKTPGIDRCSSWSGYGESGKECAYAFIPPSSLNDKDSSDSGTISPELRNSSPSLSPTTSASPGANGSSNSGAASSSSVSGIAVNLETTSVRGSSLVVAETALVLTEDPAEAASISALAIGITDVSTIQKSLFQWFPRDRELNYKVESLTPNVCLASTWRVRITNAGLCKVEILITDSAGNEYELIKKMRRYF
jgi:hypothetical protein